MSGRLDRYDDIVKKMAAGTGDWILHEFEFTAWLERPLPVLYISGIPGSGKSFMTSRVITFLREQYPRVAQESSHTSVAYFFFSDSHPSTRSFYQALCDVSFQISQRDKLYAKYLSSQCLTLDDICTIKSAWRRLFTDYFVKSGSAESRTFIVLDGVDEGYKAERQVYFELLKDLDAGSAQLKCLLVGRPEIGDEITDATEREVRTIYVTLNKNYDDIVRYINNFIAKSRVLKRSSAALQTEIVDALTEGAKGMFIWVDLMLRELSTKTRETAIRESLTKAPRGLTKMLRHVLEGFSTALDEEEAHDLNILLAFVSCAIIPLALGGLDAVLTLNSPTGDSVIYLEGRLRKQYASFFTLTREDGLSTADLYNEALHQADSSELDDEDAEREVFDDVDAEIDFHSSMTSTTVTFCHASVGDFLRDRQEGKVTAEPGRPAVGVDILEAQLIVAKTCLSILCEPGPGEKLSDQKRYQYFLGYSFTYWMQHLDCVAIEHVSVEDKLQIGNRLYSMLTDESTMRIWLAAADPALFTDQYRTMFWRWLDDKDVSAALPTTNTEWIDFTKENKTDMFIFAGRFFAAKWLRELDWYAGRCFNSLRAFLLLRGDPAASLSNEASSILDTAKWAQLEENARWHQRVAAVMYDYQHHDEAEEHLQTARKMDPTLWSVLTDMAAVLTARGDLDTALEYQLKAVEFLKADYDNDDKMTEANKKTLANSYAQTGELYKKLDRDEEAFRMYETALQYDKNLHRSVINCTLYLYEHGRCADTIELLKKAKATQTEEGSDLLTEVIWIERGDFSAFADSISEAARETGELPFIVDAYKLAISAAKDELQMIVASFCELRLAVLYLRYCFDEGKAVTIWTKLASKFTSSRYEDEMSYVRNEAIVQLATIHLHKALGAVKGSAEAADHAAKLKELATFSVKSGGSEKLVMALSDSPIVLGIWYTHNGQVEEARDCFRSHVVNGLLVLSDDDPDNDASGYFQLALVLLAARKDDEAIGVFYAHSDSINSTDSKDEESSTDEESDGAQGESYTAQGGVEATADTAQSAGGKNVDDPKVGKADNKTDNKTDNNDNDTDTDNNDNDNDNNDNNHPRPPLRSLSSVLPPDSKVTEIAFACDGPCHRFFSTFDGCYSCRYCYNVSFCEACESLRKAGNFPFRLCDPQHETLLIPDRHGRRVPKGKILIGTELMNFEDFKQKLKRDWNV